MNIEALPGSISIPEYTAEKPVDILLVSTFSPKHGAAIGESLGPEVLAGHVRGEFRNQVQVDHVDLQLDSDLGALAKRVHSTKPHILGVSVKIGAVQQTEKLMQQIDSLPWSKEEKPLVVMGNVIPTFATFDLLTRFPGVVMAQQEGENVIRGLIEVIRGDKVLEQIPGITFLNHSGSPITTPSMRFDLRDRHLPARITTRRIVDELNGMVWIEGSRGCDFNCTFCSVRELHGGGFDGLIDPMSVVDDLEKLQRMGIKSVTFTDDDFGGDPGRTLIIANEIIDRNLDIIFSISTRADHVWVERPLRKLQTASNLAAHNARLRYIMERLHQAGLVRVFIGMESGSPSQLRRYGKQVSVMGNYKALEILHEIGIDVVAGYIPIDQAMTLTELQENLDFLRKTGMYLRVTNPLSVLRVQVGSPYLKIMENKGLLGEKTEDLVFYRAGFLDPRVQQIAELADRWVEDIYMLIFGLKGEVATITLGPDGRTGATAQKVQNVLYGFRELEMRFIEAVTARLLEQSDANLTPIVNHFIEERKLLVDTTSKMIKQGELGTNSRLLEAIKALGER